MPSRQSHSTSAKELPRTIPLPTATPELNPVERFFKDLRKHLKGRCFNNIQQIEHAIDFYLEMYQRNPQTVISITKFHWL